MLNLSFLFEILQINCSKNGRLSEFLKSDPYFIHAHEIRQITRHYWIVWSKCWLLLNLLCRLLCPLPKHPLFECVLFHSRFSLQYPCMFPLKVIASNILFATLKERFSWAIVRPCTCFSSYSWIVNSLQRAFGCDFTLNCGYSWTTGCRSSNKW